MADPSTGSGRENETATACARCGVDLKAMLRGLDDDIQLAQKLAELFVESSPRVLERIRRGLALGDAPEVECAAHEIKGALGNFYAACAVAAAAAVESAAQERDLARAARAFAALETEAQQIHPLLVALRDAAAGS
jgi:HPt (histidine-containing phosphotransfer) domain-containing protein